MVLSGCNRNALPIHCNTKILLLDKCKNKIELQIGALKPSFKTRTLTKKRIDPSSNERMICSRSFLDV